MTIRVLANWILKGHRCRFYFAESCRQSEKISRSIVVPIIFPPGRTDLITTQHKCWTCTQTFIISGERWRSKHRSVDTLIWKLSHSLPPPAPLPGSSLRNQTSSENRGVYKSVIQYTINMSLSMYNVQLCISLAFALVYVHPSSEPANRGRGFVSDKNHWLFLTKKGLQTKNANIPSSCRFNDDLCT